ncbi:MAG: histidine phosphatase family protein [Deltaproteobacteria bacterium]|nr:histidine phosphatase family protein [Deltaproteobacteria bacterium]MBW2322093.1 histidine phosphatase family protein [Deltaproteobacteria bacterium]
MRLYFVRHAQSADNLYVAQNIEKGVRSVGLDQLWHHRQADPELSEIGLKQARTLGKFLADCKESNGPSSAAVKGYMEGFSITHVYSSLMVRSMETASVIANALNLIPAIWEDLHETGGIWEPDKETAKPVGCAGNNRTFFKQRFPHFILPERLTNEGWWNRPLETTRECKERAQRFFTELKERHAESDDQVIVVGHGLFYSFLLKAFLKIPSKSGVQFAMNNAAMTRIDFIENSIRVIYQNKTDHFPLELIT